ncbi:MAG: M24 family metallopeptidase [Firmicutes bacterium]|nr:M24 family metallopeptidase [Bacillota bacterium]
MTSPKYQLSQKEIDRRYNAVQTALKKRNLDVLVLQTHSEIFDIYTRYLTDQKTLPDPYSIMLMVPAEGEMYYMMQGGCKNPDLPVSAEFKKHHIGKFANTTTAMCFHYTDVIPAQFAVEEIKKQGYERIGFAGKGMISMTTSEYFHEHLPGCVFEDFTDDFDNIIAVKSEEELILLQKTVDSHCEIAAGIPALVYPGRSLREIRADIFALGEAQKCELQHNIFLNAGKPFTYAGPNKFDYDYVIQKGDAVTYLLELACDGGMYAEVGRTLCLYEPSKQELDDYNLYIEGEKWITSQIKPGMTCAEIVDLNDKWFGEAGFGGVQRMAGHGQGYGLMERPAFRKDDNMIIQENMFFAAHFGGGLGATKKTHFICSNYIVKKNGSELMTWTPLELQVLNR